MPLMRWVSSFVIGCSLLSVCAPVLAADTGGKPFSDIPKNSAVLPAAEYLRSKGIVQGSDGKFLPERKLTRAEAVKILLATQVTAEELAAVKTSAYSDIAPDAWYVGYVELARQRLKLDGPPKNTEFKPNTYVRKNEFLKMLLTAKKIDVQTSFADIALAFSSDVADAKSWDYPYMRYAIAASMSAADDETFSPGQEITRGQMALLYYRLDMYLAGRRTQALLSQVEKEISFTQHLLDIRNAQRARYAANRAVISARGAFAAKPNEGIVKGALKMAEGFQLLVAGYEASVNGQPDVVIEKMKEVWALADKAKKFSPGLAGVAAQMQTSAKSMADAARKMKE